jgi:hypothetical protein
MKEMENIIETKKRKCLLKTSPKGSYIILGFSFELPSNYLNQA